MIQFNDTQIAFAWRSNSDLKKAKILFKTIGWPSLVKVGSVMLNIALAIRFPISWIIKPTIFNHFVGGEDLNESNKMAALLSQYGVKSVLDYSVEGADTEKSQEAAYNEILRSIKNAEGNPNIAFTVFKPTGLINTSILEKVSNSKSLTELEIQQFSLFKNRVKTLCQESVKSNTAILVDAEDSWYQKAIDDVVQQMMEQFNKSEALVYNTFQMYRTDRLDYLKTMQAEAKVKGYKLGAKFVRGAYMEKERARAQSIDYPSPIHPNKEATDKAFDDAQEYSFNHLDTVSIFCGTHNEVSIQKLCGLMEKNGIANNDNRITFSQLLGMSDNISFMLAHKGYNVAKYIPYGPVRKVMPYLIRRAEENTSVKGQTGRELSLIKAELKRRKKVRKN